MEKNLDNDKPVTVTSDGDIQINIAEYAYEKCVEEIRRFAELFYLTELTRIYKLTPESLITAYAMGIKEEDVIDTLNKWYRFPIPENVIIHIKDEFSKLGKVFIRKEGTGYFIYCPDYLFLNKILGAPRLKKFFNAPEPVDFKFYFRPKSKESLKKGLIKTGIYPCDITGDFSIIVPPSKIKESVFALADFAYTAKMADGSIQFFFCEGSLWNAITRGLDPQAVLTILLNVSQIPLGIELALEDIINRYPSYFNINPESRRCETCNTVNISQALFCKKCGRPLAKIRYSRICETCNSVSVPQALFCRKCGRIF